MLKKILIGIGAVVALLAVALVALVMFVDVNRFKPQIQQVVKDRYNRTLAIEGDLSLAVFPRIAVALPRTTLSEPGNARPFATLDGAKVSVAVLPLLGGRVEAGTVSVTGLAATVERHADGSTNIDDLIKGDPKAAPQPEAKKTAPPPEFSIGGVELVNANLTLRDLASKNTIALKQLNLTTSRLATVSRTPVNLSTQFSSTQPAASGSVNAKAELDLDLVKNAFGARGLDATIKGTVDKQPLDVTARAGEFLMAPGGALTATRLAVTAKGTLGQDSFDVTIDAPRLAISEQSASGERVTAAVKLGGAQVADLKLALEGLSGNAKDLKIGKLAVNGTLEQRLDAARVRRVVANLASPVQASLQAQTFALPQLAGEITMEDPAIAGKTVKLPITAALSLDLAKELVDAKLASKFDETTLNATAGVRGFTPLRVNFDASADRLNLDRYFPPAKGGAAGATKGGEAKAGEAKAGAAKGGPTEDPKVDLSGLKNLALNGEAKVGQLQARGIKTQNLRVVMKAANGRLDVAPLTASLYGGTVNAAASASADGNRITANAAMNGISIQPLLKDALDKDILEGRGNVKLDVATAGATVGAMKRALDGGGAVMLRDGAVKGINVAARLREARNFLGRGNADTQQAAATEKTDFSEMNATFVIKNGVATNNDLDLKSPLLRVTGGGSVDIPAGTIDYTVKAAVVGTLKGQDGRDINELRGVTVPVKLTGPFEQMSYRIDWGGVAQEALKSRAAEQIKTNPQVQEQRKKLEERARDAFKGLLGR